MFAKLYGSGLHATLTNGRKSGALDLSYLAFVPFTSATA
jgi:hypothetical protein